MLGERLRQQKLEAFCVWFNLTAGHRPHSMLEGRTPQEAWDGIKKHRAPALVLAGGEVEPAIRVERLCLRGGPKLSVIKIDGALRHVM